MVHAAGFGVGLSMTWRAVVTVGLTVTFREDLPWRLPCRASRSAACLAKCRGMPRKSNLRVMYVPTVRVSLLARNHDSETPVV